MKIICQKADLTKGVSTAIRAVPVHTTMPILLTILIDAGPAGIRMISNDMDMGIETKVAGEVAEPGIVAVEARMFSDIIRKLPENEVTVTCDEKYTVTITCGRARFVIGGQSGEDFPALPELEREDSIEITQFTLKNVIQQTIFSTAAGEANPIMTGELFEIHNGCLKVAALDGHRIAIRRVELKESCQDRKVIVPGKMLSEISKILPGEMEEIVRVSFSRNFILFEFEDTLVLSRLIDGEYFGLDQMISMDYETKVTVNKRELQGCIDRASLFVREGDKKPIVIEVTDGLMKLYIQSEMGSLNEEISAVTEGKDLKIGFNPRYMLDVLRVIEDEDVVLYLVSAKAPCIIRDEDQTYTYLVLPVNFSERA